MFDSAVGKVKRAALNGEGLDKQDGVTHKEVVDVAHVKSCARAGDGVCGVWRVHDYGR